MILPVFFVSRVMVINPTVVCRDCLTFLVPLLSVTTILVLLPGALTATAILSFDVSVASVERSMVMEDPSLTGLMGANLMIAISHVGPPEPVPLQAQVNWLPSSLAQTPPLAQGLGEQGSLTETKGEFCKSPYSLVGTCIKG